MFMYLQDHNYFWHRVLFHFVNLLETLSQAHAYWESRWAFADTLYENICSNFIFCFENCFILCYVYCLIWNAHTCTCLWTYVGYQSNDWWQYLLALLGPRTCGHMFQITKRISLLFCVVAYACASTQALLLTDNPLLFFVFVNHGWPVSCFVFFNCQNSWPGGPHLPATTCQAMANNLTLALLFLAHSFLKGTLDGTCFSGRLYAAGCSIVRQSGLGW